MLNKSVGLIALSIALVATPALANQYPIDRTHSTYERATKRISAEKAGQIAQSRVKNSRVVSIDYDRDDDRYGSVYEVELEQGRLNYDVKIDATTGKVIYVKQDRDDD